MTRRIVWRILWLGRGTATMIGVAVLAAVVLGVATTALAAVPGDPFKLGKKNTVDALSQLVGSANSAMLRIDNDGSGTALDLRVEPGEVPMKVDSGVQVANLNADEVDGESADAFLGANDKAADAVHADQADNAANADELDGLDSGAFSGIRHVHDDRYYTESEAERQYVNESDHTRAAHNALNIDADTLDGQSADEIGVNGMEFVTSLSAFNSDSPKEAVATCPFGKVPVGAGYDFTSGTSGSSPNEETDVVVYELRPFVNSVTVEAYEEEPTSDDWRVTAYAVCVNN